MAILRNHYICHCMSGRDWQSHAHLYKQQAVYIYALCFAATYIMVKTYVTSVAIKLATSLHIARYMLPATSLHIASYMLPACYFTPHN